MPTVISAPMRHHSALCLFGLPPLGCVKSLQYGPTLRYSRATIVNLQPECMLYMYELPSLEPHICKYINTRRNTYTTAFAQPGLKASFSSSTPRSLSLSLLPSISLRFMPLRPLPWHLFLRVIFCLH